MKEYTGQINASGLRLAIVVSRFNSIFTEQLVEGAVDCIVRHGGSKDAVAIVRVPGANELTLAVQRLARSGGFDAVLALGCVIQGATAHADLINAQVARSLAQISLETGVPVTNGVIAAGSLDQAVERSGSKMGNKGWEAAAAAIEMASLFQTLPPAKA